MSTPRTRVAFTSNPAVAGVGLLLGRVAIGIVFLAHGLQKLTVNGFDGTRAAFESMGVPVPAASAFFATWVEILGGIGLIVGALVPIFGVLLFLDMLGAFAFVHAGNGIWITDNGYELVLALGGASLVFATVGAGLYSVDALVRRRRPARVHG